jgi:hypothetical protein
LVSEGFGYDEDLVSRDEVDEKALPGLRGIVRISRTTLNHRAYPNLSGFAPASEWVDISGLARSLVPWAQVSLEGAVCSRAQKTLCVVAYSAH